VSFALWNALVVLMMVLALLAFSKRRVEGHPAVQPA
jgi:hypothetical protein